MERKKPGRKAEPASKRRIAWPRWTGFRGMTVRDWLQLLIVPFALVVIGFVFTMQQEARQQKIENRRAQQAQEIENQRAEAERELAVQRAQDEALQAYLDQMNGLLLEKDLRASEEDSEVRTLARARTLTVLSRLDPSRKTDVMQFLIEAELVQIVGGRGPIIRLGDADLSGATLSDADLSGATLSGATLSGATLSDADLSGATLSDADLNGATLSGADLSGVDLSYASLNRARLSWTVLSDANLSGVVMRDADLSYANLREANLSYANLREANLSFAILTDATRLFNATLRGADLSGAKVRRADLRTTELEKQPWSPEARPPKPGDIFADDFSDTSSGWAFLEAGEKVQWAVEYAFGGLRLYIADNPPRVGSFSQINPTAGTAIEDAIVEVDATVSANPPEKKDTNWGLICRAQDYYNYYYLGIYADGRPTIWQLKDRKWTPLETGSPSDAVRGGTATNHLRADCVGSQLTLYVNGRRVLEAEDSEFKSGAVGLFGEKAGEEIDVLFDNFLVSSP